MLVLMKAHATDEEIDAVCRRIETMGFKAHPIPGAMRTAIGITGNQGPVEAALLESLPGVAECVPVSKPYKLVGRELKEEKTVIDLGDGVRVGGRELAVIAGPCAVESREQAFAIAAEVKAAGARIFRGGAYKARTSPYTFQGLEEEGLKILRDIRAEFGIKIVTEAIDQESLDLVEQYADVIQIGARNMQNYSLLKKAGRSRRPVLLKRGMSSTLDELLMSAEYILSEGNYNVILCERGVRTFADHTRNTLDLSVVPAVQRAESFADYCRSQSWDRASRKGNSHVPRRNCSGSDGLIIEVHNHPDQALSDGYQSILPSDFTQLMTKSSKLPLSSTLLISGSLSCRISGPLLHRIDLHIQVPAVKYKELAQDEKAEQSAVIRERILAARLIQYRRLEAFGIYCNAQMMPRTLRRFCKLDAECEKQMENAITKLGLSARAYDRILRVARTMADMESTERIQARHISETIQYRSLDRTLFSYIARPGTPMRRAITMRCTSDVPSPMSRSF